MQAYPRVSTAGCVSMQAVRSRFRPRPNLLQDRSITSQARKCSTSHLSSDMYASGRLCLGRYQFWLRMLLDGRHVFVQGFDCVSYSAYRVDSSNIISAVCHESFRFQHPNPVYKFSLITESMILQALTPFSASARGSAALSTQSRDMEAEMQKLIQSRVKDGQPPLPELKLRSGVSYRSLLHATHAVCISDIKLASTCKLSSVSDQRLI